MWFSCCVAKQTKRTLRGNTLQAVFFRKDAPLRRKNAAVWESVFTAGGPTHTTPTERGGRGWPPDVSGRMRGDSAWVSMGSMSFQNERPIVPSSCQLPMALLHVCLKMFSPHDVLTLAAVHPKWRSPDRTWRDEPRHRRKWGAGMA